MSQPVVIENGEWKPNCNFPSPNENILLNIVSKVKKIGIQFNIGERFQNK